MSQFPKSNSPVHKLRAATIAGVLLFGVAGLLRWSAYGGNQDRRDQSPELLGADKKTVARVLGDGQPLASGLFNEDSSESHSGGIGSTHAYRTRIGYISDRSCYAFFMKKTGETFNPIEVIGLLYVCAKHAEWREIAAEIGFIYRATDPKGTATGRTYLATLDETASRLFVYSPEWRPDFNRELWITPDEAPVHREAERQPLFGMLPRRSTSKQAGVSGKLFGKSALAADPKQVAIVPKQVAIDPKQVAIDPKQVAIDPKQVAIDPKQVAIDPKQGIYLPELNRVVRADPDEDPKAGKPGKRKKRRQQRRKPIPPVSGK